MRVIEWRAHQSGALQGYAAVETPSGMTIHGIAVFEQAGRRWTALPSRPRLRDGRATKATSGGWVTDPIVEIPHRPRKDAWDRQVLAALDAYRAEHG